MARKYQKEFRVVMTAKTEDGDMTEKEMLAELRSKAQSVSDMRLDIEEVVQTFPAPTPATPAPAEPTPEQEAPAPSGVAA